MLRDAMRDRIDIKDTTFTRDDASAPEKSFSTVYKRIHCRVRPATQKIIEEFKQRVEDEIWTVSFIRKEMTITPAHRVVWNGKDYKIVGQQLLNQPFRLVIKEDN